MTADGVNTSVIYLVWLPFGIDHFKAFFASYYRYTAACNHQLVLAFNGVGLKHPNPPEEYLAYLEHNGGRADKCFYYQQGQDLEVYQQVARQVQTEYVLFLNSYSILQSASWLKYYIDNFDAQVGIIGASASCQSYYSSVFQKHAAGWEAQKGFLYNFRKYKLFVKAFFYWRFLFRPFPNPHIRTNAFMVRRELFLTMNPGPLDTKFRAYQFENGVKSLTAFYAAKGLKTLVVDSSGRTFAPAEWKNSRTFWNGGQENLLVSDNQTRLYTEASAEEKKTMTWLAWGTT